MNNPKISVIIPVYNVEEYLAECLDSIINQTLKEIEVICVNDGSTDNSLQILQAYALKKDSRIKIISTTNRGCGYARKIALKEAKGEYVLFCDSDDQYSTNDVFFEIYHKMKETNVDLLIFDFYYVRDKQEYRKYPVPEKDIFTYKDFHEFYNIYLAPWMKCQKKSFLDKYQDWYFPEENVSSGDMPLHFQLVLRAKSISYINKALYIYHTNPNSLQHKKTNEKKLQDFCIHVPAVNKMINKECELIKNKKELIYFFFHYFYNEHLTKYYLQERIISEETVKVIKVTCEKINEIVKEFDFSDYLYCDDLKYEQALIFFKICLTLSVDDLTKYFNNNIYRKIQKNQEQANRIQQQTRKLQEAKITIKQLQHSKSYRIGHLIITPISIPIKGFRLIRDYRLLKKSDLFDSEYYLANNEDVRKAKINPIMHYLRFGWKEGRNPSEQFNNKAYLAQRPDVKVAGVCPLVHYLKFGKKE